MNDDNQQNEITQRRAKLAALREKGDPFPNDFRRNVLAGELHAEYDGKDNAALEAQPIRVKVAGRMMAKRVMGKASFAQVQDMSGQMQLFVQRDALPPEVYEDFKKWDVGDILGAEGTLFKTKTGELSVRTDDVRLLTKALRPLPEKFHGLVDQETRYRQRYLDLIMNEPTRDTFRIRSRVVAFIRQFLEARAFMEVETPMMQVIPGGATARPFITHHNALDMQLYLRVAPELYLKRLVVGGLERVFEINRNFRNEGISVRHNPEFTMMEFYQAYATYEDLMDFTEELFCHVAQEVLGTLDFTNQGLDISFQKPWKRLTVRDAVLEYGDIEAKQLDDRDLALAYARSESKRRPHVHHCKHRHCPDRFVARLHPGARDVLVGPTGWLTGVWEFAGGGKRIQSFGGESGPLQRVFGGGFVLGIVRRRKKGASVFLAVRAGGRCVRWPDIKPQNLVHSGISSGHRFGPRVALRFLVLRPLDSAHFRQERFLLQLQHLAGLQRSKAPNP